MNAMLFVALVLLCFWGAHAAMHQFTKSIASPDTQAELRGVYDAWRFPIYLGLFVSAAFAYVVPKFSTDIVVLAGLLSQVIIAVIAQKHGAVWFRGRKPMRGLGVAIVSILIIVALRAGSSVYLRGDQLLWAAGATTVAVVALILVMLGFQNGGRTRW